MMANNKKRKVETFSYSISPILHRRWERFAAELGQNRSTAFALLIPAILDAFDEAEPVFKLKKLEDVAAKNESKYYPSESGIKFSVAINIGFPTTE